MPQVDTDGREIPMRLGRVLMMHAAADFVVVEKTLEAAQAKAERQSQHAGPHLLDGTSKCPSPGRNQAAMPVKSGVAWACPPAHAIPQHRAVQIGNRRPMTAVVRLGVGHQVVFINARAEYFTWPAQESAWAGDAVGRAGLTTLSSSFLPGCRAAIHACFARTLADRGSPGLPIGRRSLPTVGAYCRQGSSAAPSEPASKSSAATTKAATAMNPKNIQSGLTIRGVGSVLCPCRGPPQALLANETAPL